MGVRMWRKLQPARRERSLLLSVKSSYSSFGITNPNLLNVFARLKPSQQYLPKECVHLARTYGMPILPASGVPNKDQSFFILEQDQNGCSLIHYQKVKRRGLTEVTQVRQWTPSFSLRNLQKMSRNPLYRAIYSPRDPHDQNSSEMKEWFVVDACAGFGLNGFEIASYGARVLMNDRHPLVHYMLSVALNNAKNSTNSSLAEIANRIELCDQPTDSLQLLQKDTFEKQFGIPDVTFLDPLHHQKNTKGKDFGQAPFDPPKELTGSLFRRDQENLLALAKQLAANRVVFKKPFFAEIPDDQSVRMFKARTHRFEVLDRDPIAK